MPQLKVQTSEKIVIIVVLDTLRHFFKRKKKPIKYTVLGTVLFSFYVIVGYECPVSTAHFLE